MGYAIAVKPEKLLTFCKPSCSFSELIHQSFESDIIYDSPKLDVSFVL